MLGDIGRRLMKKALLLFAVMVLCSGQMCSTDTTLSGLDTRGEKNVCGRSFFEPTFRIGIDLPAGVGVPQSSGISSSISRKLTWDWSGTSPATKFILVISTPVRETSVEEVAQASLASFEQANLTVLQSFKVTLGDGAGAWYFALSPKDKNNTNVEVVMTMSQGRLVTFSATYITTVTTEQADAIGATMRSLCADVD